VEANTEHPFAPLQKPNQPQHRHRRQKIQRRRWQNQPEHSIEHLEGGFRGGSGLSPSLLRGYLGDGGACAGSAGRVAGGRLRCGGEEAAVLEQPRNPGGHGGACVSFTWGRGWREGGRRRGGQREKEVWVASSWAIFWCSLLCRDGSEFLRLDNGKSNRAIAR